MQSQKIDAKKIASMFLAGAKRLEYYKEVINELNVFPVPDGDTGTNMSLTIRSAVDEVEQLTDVQMADLCKAISSGSLRGARGNSGVILSQLFRGFTKRIKNEELVDIPMIGEAFVKAQETAYKAVMKPKEGTILTVAREMAETAAMISEDETDLESFFGKILKSGEDALNRTPEMLPVLKEAGVVDSGGRGLLEILKGAYDEFLGRTPEEMIESPVEETPSEKESLYSYETIFSIQNADLEVLLECEQDVRGYLLSIGDQVSTDRNRDILQVRLMTDDPGLALQKGLSYGILLDVQIENKKPVGESGSVEETSVPCEHKEVGFITISSGDGFTEIFEELGVDEVVTGGQTMNPSTDDILSAVSRVNADHVFILPNNKNIILAANQARDICEDKDIIVIPTTTVPQGITAMVNYMPDEDPASNGQMMTDSLSLIQTGQVTYAVRNTQINGMEIHEGDFMGIGDEGILAVGADPDVVTKDLIAKLVNEDSELISLYYGEGVTEEMAEEMSSSLEELYPDCDIECHNGGQPVYRYLLSVE